MGLASYQPFSAVYALGALSFELVRFPFFLVKYLTRYGRQHPEWTLRQSISVRVFFSMVYHIATVQVKSPLPLKPGKEKERFATLKPADDKYYTGPLRSNPDVKPVEIGATWYPAPLSKTSDLSNVRVVLHIHGGAYVVGDGRTEASGYFASKLLKNTPATHVFAPQYRLSTLPANATSNPFPAAVQDSLSSYLYLLHDLQIPAKSIIISGDSAGANAAIAILRYLADYPDLNIPAPHAALLWSPWIEPLLNGDYTRTNPNYGTDYISFPFTWWGSAAYAGAGGQKTLDHPYVNSKGHPFKTPVPMFVNTGDKEVLYFDDVAFYEMMQKAGNTIHLDVEKNVPHDILLTGKTLGFDKEATACAKRAGEWLKEL